MKHYIVLVIIFILWFFLGAACVPSSGNFEIINHTDVSFCKIVRFPDKSINAPWSGKITKIKLSPGKSIFIEENRETFLIDIFTCDDRFVITKQPFDRNRLGDSWILTNNSLIGRVSEYDPTPRPTRTPAVVTIKNETGKNICSLRLSPPEWMGYEFGENILGDVWQTDEQVVLHEPEQIKYATYALGVGFCDGTGYTTKEVTFEDIMTIALRGPDQDIHDLLAEKQGAK
jgi:hypothetical protein